MHRPRFYPATIALAALTLSIASPARVNAHQACEREQEFLVTAYYSPLPNQQHYYLGSYDEDIAFNGQGIAGTDGTNVYPGMIAAPPEYPFGTRIELPDIGAVGTVHDRGGRIVAGENGAHHIDLWMGAGEEGLARALEWGARKITGKIYAPDHEGKPAESFNLAKFPAPASALVRIPSNPIALLGIEDPTYGDTDSAVAAIQYALQKLSYLDHEITGTFGDATRDALKLFQRDSGLPVNGDHADEQTRVALTAHRNIAEELGIPLPGEEILLRGKDGKAVRVLQRVLSLLGKYQGENDGVYDANVMHVVYQFQVDHDIVRSLGDPGAGMVGPQTRRALLTAWREHRVEKRGGSREVAAL